jgi:HPt (histidine-containing phosphotransfer) domain-containing protein
MDPSEPDCDRGQLSSEMDKVIKEFLVECNEGLDRFDRDLVALEKDRSSRELLDSIFRAIHTIKGTGGVLGYEKLVSISHIGETQRLNLITTELQEGVMKTRMQPIGMVWNKLPRVVRDHGRGDGQANPAGDGRRRDGAGPDHHRSHQGPAGAPGSQLVRPRYRAGRSPDRQGQVALWTG